MIKKLVCLVLTVSFFLTLFVPIANAKSVTMYSSDGRTRSVDEKDVSKWQKVGWFTSKDDAKIITMYSSDGRTISIPKYYREAYLKLWWYDSAEDAKLITMYSIDGRSVAVAQCKKEAYEKVGWYADIKDVTVTMYDDEGNEYTVFKANINDEIKNGLSRDSSIGLQLMFSADGRFKEVSKKDVDAYKKVGWYRAGSDKVDPNRPMVALTYDDGPGIYTNGILDVLDKYNARATFFVVGQYVAGNKDVLKKALKIGCEIGNHTWNHPQLTRGVGTQISATNKAVYEATGVYPKVYRPPYGSYNASVLSSIPMPAILWSVDTLDWKTRNTAKNIASVQNNTRDGSIILMHDIHLPTANAAEPIIKWLLMNDYQLVTVTELLDARCGGAENGKIYRQAP